MSSVRADRPRPRGVASGLAPLLVAALGAVAAVVYTLPLAVHCREAIPYAHAVPPGREVQRLVPGDHLQLYYYLSLAADMASGRIPLFSDPYQFRAPRPPSAPNVFFLPFSLLFAAASGLGRPLAYDLLVWLSFPATALAVFALARGLDLGEGAAIVAGVAAMLSPYRVGSVASGHPDGLVLFLLPLAFALLERAWRAGDRRAAAVAGLAFALLAINELHLLYFAGFLLPAWALWKLAQAASIHPARARDHLDWIAVGALGPTVFYASYDARRGHTWDVADLLGLFAVFAAVLAGAFRAAAGLRLRAGETSAGEEALSFLPLLALALYPLQFALDRPYVGRVLVAAALAGVAALQLPVLRAVARLGRDPDVRAALRRFGALGPALPGLAAAGALVVQYKLAFLGASADVARHSAQEIRAFAPVAADFVKRTSGPLTHDLYVGGAVAALALFGLRTPRGRLLGTVGVLFAGLALGPRSPHWLPLYRAAAATVPWLGLIRQTGKFFWVAATLAALVAGIGASVVAAALPRRWRALAFAAAVVAIAVDFSSVLPFGVSLLPVENRAYDAVARRAAGSNLLEMPIWPGDSAYSSIYQYWSTRTRVGTVNGYNRSAPAGYLEHVAHPLESMNLGELTAEQHALLDRLEVRLVTLHSDAFPPQVSPYGYRFTLAAMRQDPNLAFVTADGGVFLFERRADYQPWTPRVGTPLGVLFEAERLGLDAGTRVADDTASAGTIVAGHGDPAHARPIVYGPYRTLPRGTYVVWFRVRGAGRVEATHDFGKAVLATRSFDTSALDEVSLPLVLDQPTRLEFRTWPADGRDAALDWVLVEKTDAAPVPPGRIEGEDLVALAGVDGEDPQASGGAYATAGAVAGTVVRDGPYRLVPRGPLRLAVRSRGGRFLVRVESADGRRRFVAIPVAASATWRTTEVTVDVPQPTVLCTRVVSAGDEADLDYVDLGR